MQLARLTAQLKIDEGVRLKVYNDSMGIPTIGTGRNLRDKGITEAENDYLLANDIVEVGTELSTGLPWWNNLDDVRQEVLANMAFNLGFAKMLGFHNTLTLIQDAKFDDAANAMKDSAWFREVGDRAKRLVYAMRTGAFGTPEQWGQE